MEGYYNPQQVMSAQNGTKVVTSGLSSSQFRGFVANEDTVVSALASQTRTSTGSFTANSDVLEGHIEGGSGTTLKAGVPVICQQHSFTDVTVDSGSITVIF